MPPRKTPPTDDTAPPASTPEPGIGDIVLYIEEEAAPLPAIVIANRDSVLDLVAFGRKGSRVEERVFPTGPRRWAARRA